MPLFAHSEAGYGWGGPFQPWEIHPALNHLPVAFLLAAVAIDLYAWRRQTPGLTQVAGGLLIAGVLTGILAALSGILAFFTVPAHTEVAHVLMYWHLGFQVAALLLFAWLAWRRWRKWSSPPRLASRLIGVLGATLLCIGSGIGGYIVYHGAAGVDPQLLVPEVRQSHSHGSGSTEHASSERPVPHHEQDHND